MKWVKRSLLGLLVIVVSVAGTASVLLVRSLPDLDGRVALGGLDDEVTVRRDSLGVPTLVASTRRDLARATGFVHAQDRYFQMDLMRRRAAGELSALFGPAAIDADRDARLHRFRWRARQVVDLLPGDHRALLEAYAAGVNDGVAALGARPFEYLLTNTSPDRWAPEDSILVIYFMYLRLNDELGQLDASRQWLLETLPEPMVAFLMPRGTDWDAPIVGGAFATPSIPGPDVVDLRRTEDAPRGDVRTASRLRVAESLIGSNNWAVDGRRSADGRAMVASDMHLPLSVPNVFYRARLELVSDHGFEATGLTLPGMPVVVAGSNGYVAWAFTNSYGDWTDLVRLEFQRDEDTRYRTPEGYEPLRTVEEVIEVKGGEPETMTVAETRWGPVRAYGADGRRYAVRWLAHLPAAANLEFFGFELARDLDAAMAAAQAAGTPPQNVMLADREGNIAWTIMGRIPVRRGYEAAQPADWAEAGVGWNGWLPARHYPRVVNPDAGLLWTANARVVNGTMLKDIGDGGYALGARARQIRDGLMSLQAPGIDDMLRVQLDDRALFYQRWHGHLWSVMDGDDGPRYEKARRVLGQWGSRASVDSAGFRLVYEYRGRLIDAVLGPLTEPARQRAGDEDLHVSAQAEGPVWRLVTERPAHLLDPRYRDWDALFADVLDETLAGLADGEEGGLDRQTWGERNRAAIRHPLSAALPALGRWLDMPADPLPGATHMPRVQTPAFGASARFAVSPGHEESGYMHMPTGQSGHPLSPFYSKGHDAWVEGTPLPFLPGEPVHTLTLAPAN